MRKMIAVVAVVAAVALLATGCDWFVSEPGQVLIGRQEPGEWEMTIDPADLVVPAHAIAWDGNICGSDRVADDRLSTSCTEQESGAPNAPVWEWDGDPFSWQCYLPAQNWASQIGERLPVAVGPLEITFQATAGDFARVTYQIDGGVATEPTPSCANDPGFVPMLDLSGIARAPISNSSCNDVLIDGELIRPSFGYFDNHIVGPFQAGPHTFTLGCDYSNGATWANGSQLLFVELFDTASSGTVP
jgi:hypothetical protein